MEKAVDLNQPIALLFKQIKDEQKMQLQQMYLLCTIVLLLMSINSSQAQDSISLPIENRLHCSKHKK
eukprot:15336294-Ditylum_brightwellii.AAC.1